MSIWDDPALQAPPEPAYVRLDKIGDGWDGRVVNVTKETFDDGGIAPQITYIDDVDGEQKSYTAGQTDAKRKLAELRPGTGDHMSVRLVGFSGKFKHVDVKVNARAGQQPASNGNGQQPAPTTASAPQATIHQLPTYQPQQAPIQQPAYQTAPPPVYATNAPAPAPAAPAEPACPPGFDPATWSRMDPTQRASVLAVMGNVPAF